MSDENRSRPNWSEWFNETYLGFSLEDLSPATWQRTPPDAYDWLQSWEGTWPGSEEPLYVQAAAYRGRPVFFEVLHPQDVHQKIAKPGVPRTDSFAVNEIIWMGLQFLAIALACRNLWQGRGDRRGALRIALFGLGICLVRELFYTHHITGVGERELLTLAVNSAVGDAVTFWIYYMAMEPFVRRYWPELMITWSRVLNGRLGDPRFGRDLLVGSLLGVLGAVGTFASHWLGIIPSPYLEDFYGMFWTNALEGTGSLIGSMFLAVSFSLQFGLLLCLWLLGMRLLVRSRRLAACCLFLFGIAYVVHKFAPIYGVFSAFWLEPFVWIALITLIMVRLGVVAFIAAIFATCILRFPITVDTSAFYFRSGLFWVAVVVAMALYGWFTSRRESGS